MGVMGSDSVFTAIFQGKLFWVWGDTHRASYPLGNFQVTGATSSLDAIPEQGVSLNYFRGPDGFTKQLARMPGEGPTWLHALFVVKDDAGEERLCAMYEKVKPPLTIYERGLCTWDPEDEVFEHTLTLLRMQSGCFPVIHLKWLSREETTCISETLFPLCGLLRTMLQYAILRNTRR